MKVFSVRRESCPFPFEKVAHCPILDFFYLPTTVSRNLKMAQRPAMGLPTLECAVRNPEALDGMTLTSRS